MQQFNSLGAIRLDHPAAQACIVGGLACIAINSQFSALVNQYIVNGDVPIHIYWMEQFRDNELFGNDLLTRFAIYIQPWGFIAFYRTLSFFADPLFLSKIVPIALFTVTVVYLFFLVRQVANNYTAFLAATAFMIVPDFFLSMVGGHARAFGHVLVVSFLYYLIKQSHRASTVLLVLQALFYPSVFFICALTYCYSLLYNRGGWFSLKRDRAKVVFFLLASLLSVGILLTKYISGSEFGPIVSKSNMVDRPEFYSQGRFPVLPTPSFLAVAKQSVLDPVLNLAEKARQETREFVPEFRGRWLLSIPIIICFILVALYLARVLFASRALIPLELAYVVVSGVVLFYFADIVMFRLYMPDRYVQYTLPLASLVVVCIGIDRLLVRLGDGVKIKALRFLLLLAILAHFNFLKDIGLINLSKNEALYRYLETLPKDSLIVAYPGRVADYVPTFSKRKVFINFELSQPWMDKYWDVIRHRTFEFFDAYYSDNPQEVLSFCRRNHVDYVVVDRRDFSKEFLHQKKIYFEPFDSYLRKTARATDNYALLNVPERKKLFSNGDIYVINANALAM